jgi:hypothetical protein
LHLRTSSLWLFKAQRLSEGSGRLPVNDRNLVSAAIPYLFPYNHAASKILSPVPPTLIAGSALYSVQELPLPFWKFQSRPTDEFN